MLEGDLLRQIDDIAQDEARTRSELIREAARLYIERKRKWETLYAYGESIAAQNNPTEYFTKPELSKNRICNARPHPPRSLLRKLLRSEAELAQRARHFPPPQPARHNPPAAHGRAARTSRSFATQNCERTDAANVHPRCMRWCIRLRSCRFRLRV
ncbi:MAG: hypothetical protein Ta2A_07230 [Treponemataceae bacterium]|nr:MAG: hypothetical protein Ta2A_07230 [Treponemataceae bacterium]